MRFSHAMLYGIAAATFGFLATAPGSAQTPDPMMSSVDEPTPAQKAQMKNWSSDQQAAYKSWPAETQSYYWTLSPDRQMLFWQIDDETKLAITAMTGPEREAAWSEIESEAVQTQGY